MAMCGADGIISSAPTCAIDSGCTVESAALQYTTGGAASTTCPANMIDGQSCQSICNAGAKVEGAIKCTSGRLVDVSHCVETGVTVEKVLKMSGTVNVEVAGTPTVESLTNAIAAALGVAPQYVSIILDTIGARRLFSGLQSAPARFLASNVNVRYEVVVPADITATMIATAAMALSESNSIAGQAFKQSMLSSGVEVLSIVQVYPPVAVESFAIKQPAEQPPGLETSESSDVDVAAVIGGATGGCFVVLMGVSGYLWFVRRKSESGNPLMTQTVSC